MASIQTLFAFDRDIHQMELPVTGFLVMSQLLLQRAATQCIEKASPDRQTDVRTYSPQGSLEREQKAEKQ